MDSMDLTSEANDAAVRMTDLRREILSDLVRSPSTYGRVLARYRHAKPRCLHHSIRPGRIELNHLAAGVVDDAAADTRHRSRKRLTSSRAGGTYVAGPDRRRAVLLGRPAERWSGPCDAGDLPQRCGPWSGSVLAGVHLRVGRPADRRCRHADPVDRADARHVLRPEWRPAESP